MSPNFLILSKNLLISSSFVVNLISISEYELHPFTNPSIIFIFLIVSSIFIQSLIKKF